MALAGSPENSRTATAVTQEIDDYMVSLKLVMEGIQPVMFGDKTRSKNAAVDVKFEPSSLSVVAKVESPKNRFTTFKYQVKKLPSSIDVKQSSWKVKKDMISMKLRKTSPNTWVPYLSGGLDQAPESDSEEEQAIQAADSSKKEG